ncbi:MAG: O-antigen ligase family protein, partial [Candidatus Pacebacteria bacterium]|nr:O-antigen ligase family protein [Candidatus Paceibacterota bacterium]
NKSLSIQKISLFNKVKRFLRSAIAPVEMTDSIVSRETISKINNNVKNTVIKFKELFIAFLLLIFLIISNFSIIQARISGDLLSNGRLPDNSAISDRNFYNNVSRETISENFVFGSGLGTYIFQIDGYLEKNNIKQEFQSWQYQPAHNIYLLIASEIGIIGLIFFLLSVVYAISGSIKIVSRETIDKSYFSADKGRLGEVNEISRDYNLNKSLSIQKISLLNKVKRFFRSVIAPVEMIDSNVSRETILNVKLNYFLIAILVSFLFIGLFDHYFWTLQQGRLMFWLVLGLMLVNNNIISRENKY